MMYRSVPHIRPLFCNLSASRKHMGGLYAGSDILSREYAPSSSATPRCWHGYIGTLYYTPIEAADLPSLLILSSPEPQKLDGQDRLTEICHSVDSSIFQAFRGFVLSKYVLPLLIDTTLKGSGNETISNMHGEFLSCSMDAGFVLALPQGPWTWQCRSFNKDHFGRMVMVGGPIRQMKIPVQELWLKM